MATGFLIGTELLSDIRRTIDRVQDESIGSGVRRIATELANDEPPKARVFRIAVFSGAWGLGEEKSVTMKFSGSTAATVVATNLFADVPTPSGATGDCAIAREGTAWFLIAAVCNTAT